MQQIEYLLSSKKSLNSFSSNNFSNSSSNLHGLNNSNYSQEINFVNTIQSFDLSFEVPNKNENNKKEYMKMEIEKEKQETETVKQDYLQVERESNILNDNNNKSSTSSYPLEFISFSINDINVGAENYQRMKQTVFLKSLRYSISICCTGVQQGTFIRYGFFYDKSPSGQSSYTPDSLFRNVLNEYSDDINDPYSIINALSKRNTDKLQRFLIVEEHFINFSRNVVLYDLETNSIFNEQQLPGDYYVEEAISLEPLITVFNKNSEKGDQIDKMNGNLCIFFFPYVTSTTIDYNPKLRFNIQFNVRLAYSCTKGIIDISKDSTYLSNPYLFHFSNLIRKAISSTQDSETSRSAMIKINQLFNSRSILSVDKQVDLCFDAFLILTTTSKYFPNYSIAMKKCNGLCYMEAGKISEINYIDYYSKNNQILYYKGHENYDYPLVFIINQVSNGVEINQKMNSKITLLEIEYSMFVRTLQKNNNSNKKMDIVNDTNKFIEEEHSSLSLVKTDPYSRPLVLTVSIFYDKSSFIDINSYKNIVPEIDQLYSGVIYDGSSVSSPFKTVQFPDRFILLDERDILLDTRDNQHSIYLNLSSNQFNNNIKLYNRNIHESEMTEMVLNVKEIKNTKEAAHTTENKFCTCFNPVSFINDKKIDTNIITSGALYLVIRTQQIDEDKDALTTQLLDFSTRVYYYS